MSAVDIPGQGVRLDLEGNVLGYPKRWAVDHRGFEYPGEIVVVETVNPEWGQPLEGDICFRVVFHTGP